MEYKFTIPLRPITKKNSQRIIKDGSGRYRIIPSAAYKKYEKQCASYVPQVETIDCPVNVKKIIEEFQATLDHKYPVAKDFEAVYSYLLKRLFDANIRKDPEILEEVLRHLRTMRDTWKEVMAKTANGNNIKTKEPVA